MQSSNIYLDHNATSPLLPEAAQAMSEAAQQGFGNPSSPHWAGREARMLLEQARDSLAQSLRVLSQEIFFTGGGTESNNTVLRQYLQTSGFFAKNRQKQTKISTTTHLIISAIEHPSVLETCRVLARQSGPYAEIHVTELPVAESGRVNPETLRLAIRPETALISVMSANNETGTLQPIEELSAIAQEHKVPFHTDATQAVGKTELNWVTSESGSSGGSGADIDFATATAHKLGGPRGIGLLYVKQGTPFLPLITGGKQERTRRAGTENVVLAVGFAKAVEWYLARQNTLRERFLEFRKTILNELKSIDDIFFNTDLERSLPQTLNFGCCGISAESLLISLDLDGIAVSSGSACSSGALEASHVLSAMGRSRSEAKSSLRISWGWNTTAKEVEFFLERVIYHLRRLQAKQKQQC